MNKNVARIAEVRNDPPFVPSITLNRLTVVIIGDAVYEFTQVFSPSGVIVDNTVIWARDAEDDVFNWNEQVIGTSDLSVREWLESKGFEVVTD